MGPVKKSAQKAAGVSAEEVAAVKEYIQEKRGLRENATEGEREVLEKIAAMPQPDRGMAERIHAIVKANAPMLSPKTWYGMPAWAKDGNVTELQTAEEKRIAALVKRAAG